MSSTFNWKRILIVLWLTALGFYAYSSYKIAQAANHVKELALNPAHIKPLDLCYMGFDRETVNSSFTAMGEVALGRYRILEIWEDGEYPIAYMLLLVTTTILLIRYLKVHWAVSAVLIVLPVLAMLFDFFENAYIVLLIDEFPEINDLSVQKASKYNTYKWIFVTCSLASTLLLGTISIRKRMKYNTTAH